MIFERVARCLILSPLDFYSSPFPKLPASLYPLLLPQLSLLPNHLSYLGSPPASQTKLRIPLLPSLLKKLVQKIPANPLALLPSLRRLPLFSPLLSCPNRATRSKITSPQKLASKNQTPKIHLSKKRRISSRPHKHPKKHPLASKKHPQNLIPKNPKISQNIWNQKLEYRP